MGYYKKKNIGSGARDVGRAKVGGNIYLNKII